MAVCGRGVRVAAVAVCARDVLNRPLPCRVCSLCRSDRGGVSSHVAVFVFGRSAATVAGRVAVGSWNADGMPCVMSGCEDVRPVVVSGAAVMVSAVERMQSAVVVCLIRPVLP